MMGCRVVLSGDTGLFTPEFIAMLDDCGFEARVLCQGGPEAQPDELPVVGVSGMDGLASLKSGGGRPLLVYTALRLDREQTEGLRRSGALGVMTPETTPEEASFLVNNAFFHDKMVRRNPRAPVSVPVALESGGKVLSSTATLLSRDGIFVVSLNPLPAGSSCRISFTLPGTGRLSTGCTVLYNVRLNRTLSIISSPRDAFTRMVGHPGMALAFTDLPARDRELIDGYIAAIP